MTTLENNAVEQHYTVKQTCGLLGISRATLYRLVKEGALTKIKLGGKITLFSATAIRECLAQQGKNNVKPH